MCAGLQPPCASASATRHAPLHLRHPHHAPRPAARPDGCCRRRAWRSSRFIKSKKVFSFSRKKGKKRFFDFSLLLPAPNLLSFSFSASFFSLMFLYFHITYTLHSSSSSVLCCTAATADGRTAMMMLRAAEPRHPTANARPRGVRFRSSRATSSARKYYA